MAKKTKINTLVQVFFHGFFNTTLRARSNVIFIAAFIIPALILLSLGIFYTSVKIKNKSLINSNSNQVAVDKSYKNSLQLLETQAEVLSENINLKLLVATVTNTNQYYEENPLVVEWTTKLLKQMNASQGLTGMVLFSLKKDIITYSNPHANLPRSIAESPLIDAALNRLPVSENQLVPVSVLYELNDTLDQSTKLPSHLILQLSTAPILENHSIIGVLMIYRFLHQQTSWIENLAKELHTDIAIYVGDTLLLQRATKYTLSESFVNWIAFKEWTGGQELFPPVLGNNLDTLGSASRAISIDNFEKKLIGTILINTRNEQYFNEIITSLALLIFLSSVIIVMGIIFRIWIFRILNRLRNLTVVVQNIAKGNYTNLIPINRTDVIGDLTEEINKMTGEIQKREKFKDDFLANTSHELRTPLQGIIGIAESMRDGATGELPEQTLKQLQMITQSGKRLARLVNDILDYAKLKNVDLVLETKPTDIFSLVDVVLQLSQPLAEKKQLQLINQVSSLTPLVECDEERALQILFNLIGNAIKFTENGSITVTAEQVEQILEISVTDTGIGIPEENHTLIFQSFQRGTPSIERRFGGTGLGLSMVKYLVKLHGGLLDVESVVDKGSRFYFTFPISNDQTAKNISPHSYASEKSAPIVLPSSEDELHVKENGTGTNQYEILIVDDEPINVQVLSNYLINQDYSISKASYGTEALELIQNRKPDLVLLDIMMPGISGFEVCRQLRKIYPMHTLPIIFLTAKSQVSDLLEGFSLGANDYITKPFQKNELLARVERHLEINQYTERLSRLNQFSNQLIKFSNMSQMFESAFHLINEQLSIHSGVLLQKDKIIQTHNTPEPDRFLKLFKKEVSDEEIRCMPDLPDYHLISVCLRGFKDFQLIVQCKGDCSSFSLADYEYIKSIINLIRISRYNIQELLKEPVLLSDLFAIQTKLDNVLYIQIRAPYCYVHMENEKQPKIHRITMKMLQRFFPEELLLKIQRSYLVNPNKMIHINRSGKNDVLIKMTNGERLPISRNLVSKIRSKYPGYFQF